MTKELRIWFKKEWKAIVDKSNMKDPNYPYLYGAMQELCREAIESMI